MGTLFNQPERNRFTIRNKDLLDSIETLKELAEKSGISLDQAIKIAEIKQLERGNDLFASNGDIHDEQLAGFGEILEKIATALESDENF